MCFIHIRVRASKTAEDRKFFRAVIEPYTTKATVIGGFCAFYPPLSFVGFFH
jgi:hypothetical protein